MAIMRRLATLLFLCAGVAFGQVINCPSGFSSSGSCGVAFIGGSGQKFAVVGSNSGSTPALSGTAVNLLPGGVGSHTALSFLYQTAVNVQAFTATFTFTTFGGSLAFVANNNTVFDGALSFSAGAGAEAGFYQGAGGSNTPPNNVWALNFDSFSYLQNSDSSFTYSSVQQYQMMQAPYVPLPTGTGDIPAYAITKLSTSPVPMNSPSNSQGTYTGDTFSATITYDGSTVTLNLFDITAGGSCPGASCFTQTWSNISIPSIVNGNTAVVGLTEGSGGTTSTDLLIKSFSYTVNSPTGTIATTAWNAGSTYNSGVTSVASPVYSLAPGTYSGTQSVTITDATTPHSYICYVLSSTTPAFYPQPDQQGGCIKGTLYSGAVSISSTQTLYARAAANMSSFSTGATNPSTTGLAPPSTLTAATFTITGTTASTPTFSPVAGTYNGSQSVAISSTVGAIICYSTTTTPATNGSTGCTTGTLYSGAVTVSSSETLHAVGGGAGFTDSSAASAAYVIQSPASAPTFSPVAGTYGSAQTVTISTSSSSAIICYNTTGAPATNGTTGCATGTLYTGAVTISGTEVLYATAGGTGYADSSVASAAYTISIVPPKPTSSSGNRVSGGNYSEN